MSRPVPVFPQGLGLPSLPSPMNKIHFSCVFISGVIFSISILLLSELFVSQHSNGPKAYSGPLLTKRSFNAVPDDIPQQVDVDVDGHHLELALASNLHLQLDKPIKLKVSESEALGSLHAALAMKLQGKLEKALKLFEHSMALAPQHPDVLNHYGEFLETTQDDVVEADHLYFQALTYSPAHSRALINRQRTASIVEEMDQATLHRIDMKRDKLSAIPDTNSAFRRVKKEAYFQHIYHTVAIEGNSMTPSQTRSIVETRMAIAGKSIVEHNEILGLDAAMKYINATLVNKLTVIGLKDILEIHRRVLGWVDPLESGQFRRTQVFVGGHIPPPPSDIQQLMEAFADWLNSDHALRMHPVRYAAVAHHKLVHIHPFTDGNGRTARLLMNTILMQAGFPPVIIVKQERYKYYQLLDLANRGDVRPFVRFIAQCTERTLNLFLWATTEYHSKPDELAGLDSRVILAP